MSNRAFCLAVFVVMCLAAGVLFCPSLLDAPATPPSVTAVVPPPVIPDTPPPITPPPPPITISPPPPITLSPPPPITLSADDVQAITRLKEILTEVKIIDADLDAGFAARTKWLERHGDEARWTGSERKQYELGTETALDLEAQREMFVREYNHTSLSLPEGVTEGLPATIQ